MEKWFKAYIFAFFMGLSGVSNAAVVYVLGGRFVRGLC